MVNDIKEGSLLMGLLDGFGEEVMQRDEAELSISAV